MTDKGGAQRFSALVIIAALAAPLPAVAQQPSSADVNAANNPLTPKITINFQDQAAPELYDLDQGSNTFLFRGVLPNKLGGISQLSRFTLPVVTAPDGHGGSRTGLGDLNLLELFPFVLKQARMELAIGPQLTLPTATDDLTGTGKWQAGLATLAVVPRSFGIAGALVTWQHSFAGDDARPAQNHAIGPAHVHGVSYSRRDVSENCACAARCRDRCIEVTASTTLCSNHKHVEPPRMRSSATLLLRRGLICADRLIHNC